MEAEFGRTQGDGEIRHLNRTTRDRLSRLTKRAHPNSRSSPPIHPRTLVPMAGHASTADDSTVNTWKHYIANYLLLID